MVGPSPRGGQYYRGSTIDGSFGLYPPGRELEGPLVRDARVHRLAVRDDHVLEGKLEQLTQGRQRPFLMPRVAQTSSSPRGAISASAKTRARCSGSQSDVSLPLARTYAT
jgi:hypothetical protein